MNKKILVVDESWTMRGRIRMALSHSDFDVIEAQDGVDGLQRLDRNPDVAMIICEVHMLRMSGLEMIEAVRRNPWTCKLPVLMLTAAEHANQMDCVKEAGAKAWLVKPFGTELLLEAVNKMTPGPRPVHMPGGHLRRQRADACHGVL